MLDVFEKYTSTKLSPEAPVNDISTSKIIKKIKDKSFN